MCLVCVKFNRKMFLFTKTFGGGYCTVWFWKNGEKGGGGKVPGGLVVIRVGKKDVNAEKKWQSKKRIMCPAFFVVC